MRPHRLQPTRLLHPWDFPGKSTGVGCHCLLREFLLPQPNSCLQPPPYVRPCMGAGYMRAGTSQCPPASAPFMYQVPHRCPWPGLTGLTAQCDWGYGTCTHAKPLWWHFYPTCSLCLPVSTHIPPHSITFPSKSIFRQWVKNGHWIFQVQCPCPTTP